MDNRLPIIVFDFKQAGGLRSIMEGKHVGTLVRGE
jgi:uridylate kinase